MKKSTVTVSRVYVTPKMAIAMLVKNINNRPLDINHVRGLKAAVENGEWLENGDTISFNYRGELTNGQHRLSMVVMTNIAQWFIIVEGLSADAFPTIDTGKPRTGADIVGMLGAKNRKEVAAVLRNIHAYETYGDFRYVKFSHTQLVKKFHNIDAEFLNQCLSVAIKTKKSYHMPTLMAAIGFVCGKDNFTKFEDFTTKLRTGMGYSSEADPARALREQASEWNKNKPSANGRARTTTSAITVKAVKAHLAGTPLTRISFRATEAFPKLFAA